jgi:hypothetical protein
MPATTEPRKFTEWLTRNRRSDLAPLRDGSTVCERMRKLQPFHHADPDSHPLRILAEHTNLAKHRTPAVAATLLGTVIADRPTQAIQIPAPSARPIDVGDILASAPRGQQIPLSIWPKVSIRRPHTGTWHVAVHELGELADWVRTTAVPILVTGKDHVNPILGTRLVSHAYARHRDYEWRTTAQYLTSGTFWLRMAARTGASFAEGQYCCHMERDLSRG